MTRLLVTCLALALSLAGCARIPLADDARAWGYETSSAAPATRAS